MCFLHSSDWGKDMMKHPDSRRTFLARRRVWDGEGVIVGSWNFPKKIMPVNKFVEKTFGPLSISCFKTPHTHIWEKKGFLYG